MWRAVKNFFTGSQEVVSPILEGTLYYMPNSDINSIKKALIQQAEIQIQGNIIVITNPDYDPDQEQLEKTLHQISDRMQMTHYLLPDDDLMMFGYKWNSQDAAIQGVLSVEFFEQKASDTFKHYYGRALFLQKNPNMEPTEEDLEVFIEFEGLVQDQALSQQERMKLQSNMIGQNYKTTSKFGNQTAPTFDYSQEEYQKRDQIDFYRNMEDMLGNLYDMSEILYVTPGNLYRLDQLNNWELLERGVGLLLIRKENYTYFIDIVAQNQIILRTALEVEANVDTNFDDNDIQWIQRLQDDMVIYKFDNCQEIDKFTHLVNVGYYESRTKQDIMSADPDAQEFIKSINQFETENDSQISESLDMELDTVYGSQAEDEVIKTSINSMTNDLTFVAQENVVSLYEDGNNSMQKRTTLPLQSNFYPLDVKQMMLQGQDNQIVFLSKNDQTSMYQMDVERGQIVNEWKADGQPITQICPLKKFSPNTPEQCFVSVNQKSIHTIDPRVNSQNKSVNNQTYQRNPKMSCVATTGAGYLATGSENGDIRLYTKVGQRAKTQIAGISDPVIGIDTTQEGDWVLATCKTYLLAIPVQDKDLNGFKQRLGQRKKNPRKLQLTCQDCAKYGITEINFTPARFNIGSNGKENTIITSTGPYSIIWNFQKVKRNSLRQYTITRMEEDILNNEFKYNKWDQAVITMPSKLTVQKNRLRR